MKKRPQYLRQLMMNMHIDWQNYIRTRENKPPVLRLRRRYLGGNRLTKRINNKSQGFPETSKLPFRGWGYHMIPIRTTVVGSYPFPGWLEFASQNLNKFGAADIEEMIEDAVIAAIHDQVTAGLDVITDGEQTRLDFNLSFYGFIKGIENNETE